MRICHFGSSHSSHVRRWVGWFAARGHENHIVTDLPSEIEGVTLHVLPSLREFDPRPRWERFKDWSIHDWRLRHLRILKWARDRVKEINPDIVHSHMLWYPGMLGAFVSSKKYVITVFNGDVSWRKDRRLINCLGLRFALHKADAITSVSRNLLEDCLHWGARKEKLHHIMRGVDLSRFHPVNDRLNLRRTLGLSPGPVVLSPRSASKLYNLDTILLATPEVIRHFPNAQVVFMWQSASEEEATTLKTLAASLNLERNVHFVGNVPYERVHLYNQAADVMVSVPSHDGVSSSILEAMSCGDVPVASDLHTVREWIKSGENGLLVTPRDIKTLGEAIINLLKNEGMRKTIAEQNWKLIKEKGGQDYWMGKMEELYSSLIRGTRIRNGMGLLFKGRRA